MWLVLGFTFLIASLWPLFDATNFIPEFLNQARIQISVLFLAILFFALWKRKFLTGSLIAAVLVFNVYWIASSYPTLRTNTAVTGAHFRIFSQNIYMKNKELDAVVSEVKASDADAALLIEVGDDVYRALVKNLVNEYPFHRYSRTHRTKPGIALFSKYPLLDNRDNLKTRDRRLAMLNYQVLYGDQIIDIFGLHLESPRSKDRIVRRNRQLDLVLEYLAARAEDDHPLVVIGDMNTAPWNPKFRQFQHYANLQNTDSYLSIKPSWPTWLPSALGFPVDHVLVNNSFCDASKQRMGMAGSDHYGFISDLYICGDNAKQITKITQSEHPQS